MDSRSARGVVEVADPQERRECQWNASLRIALLNQAQARGWMGVSVLEYVDRFLTPCTRQTETQIR